MMLSRRDSLPWRHLRYLLLATHYRTNLNFTWETLSAARDALESIDATFTRVRVVENWPDQPGHMTVMATAMRDLRAAARRPERFSRTG